MPRAKGGPEKKERAKDSRRVRRRADHRRRPPLTEPDQREAPLPQGERASSSDRNEEIPAQIPPLQRNKRRAIFISPPRETDEGLLLPTGNSNLGSGRAAALPAIPSIFDRRLQVVRRRLHGLRAREPSYEELSSSDEEQPSFRSQERMVVVNQQDTPAEQDPNSSLDEERIQLLADEEEL